MRRGIGVAHTLSRQSDNIKFTAHAEKLTADDLEVSLKMIEAFKGQLIAFAEKHREAINEDPKFRQKFFEMCANLGIDPVRSKKGYFGELLDLANFYSDLGVQVLTVCLATRDHNGGILDIKDCIRRLSANTSTDNNVGSKSVVFGSRKVKKKQKKLTSIDVSIAISKLACLGRGGIKIVKNIQEQSKDEKIFIVSLPYELKQDFIICLKLAQNLELAYLTVPILMEQLKWSRDRCVACFDALVKEGIAWVCRIEDDERSYWFPSFFFANVENPDE